MTIWFLTGILYYIYNMLDKPDRYINTIRNASSEMGMSKEAAHLSYFIFSIILGPLKILWDIILKILKNHSESDNEGIE